MPERGLQGTVSLVTGALGGIGRATCDALAQAGSTVIGTDLAADPGDFAAGAYRRLDVTDEGGWRSIIEDVGRDHGRLDNLIQCAGVEMIAAIATTQPSEFRKCMDINVNGGFLGLQAAQPLLASSGARRKGGSSVIFLSSVGGLRGAPLMSAYCSSKGAVTLLAKSAAVEFGALDLPIRVNSVHPGCIDTGMMDRIYDHVVAEGAFPDEEAARSLYASRHPIGRMGDPEEVADAILFLCSSEASFMTGSEIVIDGGLTAG
ncbi:SDR family NAD(P)-dependent oxidoreductase [Sphingobium sp.]|uniref:SDR family NAD(P)-dependent oxidoreductase n=1 Tax=Sphingobium sp. TaxID=1912891 RepID=UPI002BBAD79B|nr:SDR family oxidoreductase [Sphingobium sp.]HUD90701.1 SDR family oxidoreductase [Sphingobium sp.]